MTLQVIALAGLLIACMGPLSVVYFLCMLRQPKDSRQGSISIVLALTGPSPRLASLFAALAQQQLQPRRLIVAVESEADPAFLRVQACRGMVPFPVDLVVAGLAEHSSQKSKNLLAALSLIDDQDKVVVLFDADIAPTAEWLGYLCSPILSGNFDLADTHGQPMRIIHFKKPGDGADLREDCIKSQGIHIERKRIATLGGKLFLIAGRQKKTWCNQSATQYDQKEQASNGAQVS